MTSSQLFSREVRMSLAKQHRSAMALAAHLGISRGTLSRRLNDSAEWPLDDAVAAADWLGIDTAALFAPVKVAV